MFGLDFLFAAGLWALPLAGLPILLHLLFRHKSPVIQFSTLRFIKLSMQRTAARRRIQKWLLLACRALLIALLVWAIAQPAKKLAGNWFGNSRSAVAAIVIDTSYSMQLQDGQLSLLSKVDGMVQDLLRGQLSSAKVAVFQSSPIQSRPEEFQPSPEILATWSPLKAQPNPKPLIDRIASAEAMLEKQPADQKWLLVLSDFQSAEFGRSIPAIKDGHTILIDLHPQEARSAGVTKINVTPEQPMPGVTSEAVVEVTGRAGDSRAIILKVSSVDGSAISETPPLMANFDDTGRALVRFPLRLPAERWVLLTGALTADDAMMWDNQRSELVEIPAARTVTILSEANTPAQRFIHLALDPSGGTQADWPIRVTRASTLSGNENVAIATFAKWPTEQAATALRDFARSGRNVVLFLQPGLEDSWPAVAQSIQSPMLELLPSAPITRPAALRHAAVAQASDPLLDGLTDDKYQLNAIIVRRLVPMSAESPATAILNAVPVDPTPGSRAIGLLYRKTIGSGVCYTVATLPDPLLTNFATHPTFLPLLVRMALVSPNQSDQLNVDQGQPLILDGTMFPAEPIMQIESPQHEQYRVKLTETQTGRKFIFSNATQPGIYTWRTINDIRPAALTNVQLPAAESQLTYRPAASIAPPDALVANNVPDLQSKLHKLTAPEPQWSLPIAIVLLLLCLEAMLGSGAKMWRTTRIRGVMPELSNMGS